MKKLCIIADDLTGSTDTGVQFSKYGLSTLVIFNYKKHLENLDTSYQIISINGETRNVNDNIAFRINREIVKSVRDKGYKLFYKKIDSTLRGNPGVEIEAMLEELNLNTSFIVPSFPENGRIVVDGHLYIKNSDPIAHIPGMLKSETNRSTAVINIKEVRKGTDNLKQKIYKLKKAQLETFVIDAITDDDLKIIASALKEYANTSVIAGSAGLAKSIASEWNFNDDDKLNKGSNSILLLAGTHNLVTREQVRALALKPDSELIVVDTKKVSDSNNKKEIQKLVQKARTSLKENQVTIIAVSSLMDKNIEEYYSQMDLQKSKRIVSSLGEIANQLVSERLVKLLILTGGDTAAHVFEKMGSHSMALEKEILPGIPSGKLIGGPFEGLQVITKAGGFGEKDSFIKVVEFSNKKEGV